MLRPQQIKMISRFYAHGMSGVLLDWIKNGMIKEPDATVTMLEELLSGEIFRQIISQQDDGAFAEDRDHADPDVVGLLYALLRILRQLAS